MIYWFFSSLLQDVTGQIVVIERLEPLERKDYDGVVQTG